MEKEITKQLIDEIYQAIFRYEMETPPELEVVVDGGVRLTPETLAIILKVVQEGPSGQR